MDTVLEYMEAFKGGGRGSSKRKIKTLCLLISLFS